MKTFVIFLSLLIFSSTSNARELSETELFNRCYAHLTGQKASPNHELLKQIKSNAVSASEACIRLLNSLSFNSNGALQDSENQEKLSILNHITKIHGNFFFSRSVLSTGSFRYRSLLDIMDDQTEHLAFTKAMFDPSYEVKDILSGTTILEGIRSEGRNATRGPSSNSLATAFEINGSPFNPTFVQSGELIGFRNSRAVSNNGFRGINKNLLSSYGGGLLGSRSYLKKNFPSSGIAGTDGADSMNRRWPIAVLKDFLCKSLPAVRIADGQTFTSSEADSSFRKSTGCIQCHTSMDQLAAGVRNILAAQTNSNAQGGPRFIYPYFRNQDQGDAHVWPIKRDTMYGRRPPKGVLYFRSYTGDLVRQNFNNLEQLGRAITSTDDYYACIAKKYYHHFTGVNASLADINDPFSTVSLNEQDLFHRNVVIELGQKLKSSQNPKEVIQDILKSKIYRQEGYTFIQ